LETRPDPTRIAKQTGVRLGKPKPSGTFLQEPEDFEELATETEKKKRARKTSKSPPRIFAGIEDAIKKSNLRSSQQKTSKSIATAPKTKANSARTKSQTEPPLKQSGTTSRRSNPGGPTIKNPNHADHSHERDPYEDQLDDSTDPTAYPSRDAPSRISAYEQKEFKRAQVASLEEAIMSQKRLLVWNRDPKVQKRAKFSLHNLFRELEQLKKKTSRTYLIDTPTTNGEPLDASIKVFDKHYVTFSTASDIHSDKFIDDPSKEEPQPLLHTTLANLDNKSASLSAIFAHPHNAVLSLGTGELQTYELLYHFRVFETENNERDLACLTGSEVASCQVRSVNSDLSLLDSFVDWAPSIEFLCSEGQVIRPILDIEQVPKEHREQVIVTGAYIIPTDLSQILAKQENCEGRQNIIYVIEALSDLISARFERNLEREGRSLPRIKHMTETGEPDPNDPYLSIDIDLMDATRPYRELLQALYAALNSKQRFEPATIPCENSIALNHMSHTLEKMRSGTATYQELFQDHHGLKDLGESPYSLQHPRDSDSKEFEANLIPPPTGSIRHWRWTPKPQFEAPDSEEEELFVERPTRQAPPTKGPLDPKAPRLTPSLKRFQSESEVHHPSDVEMKDVDMMDIVSSDDSSDGSDLFGDNSETNENRPKKRPRKPTKGANPQEASPKKTNQNFASAPNRTRSTTAPQIPDDFESNQRRSQDIWRKRRRDTPRPSPRNSKANLDGNESDAEGTSHQRHPNHEGTPFLQPRKIGALPRYFTNGTSNNQTNYYSNNRCSNLQQGTSSQGDPTETGLMLQILDRMDRRAEREVEQNEEEIKLRKQQMEQQNERHRETMDKRITATISIQHRNAGTTDGTNPSEDITQLDRDCLRAKSLAETKRLVCNFALTMEGKCDPVISFLRACSDGDWVSNYSRPDKISPFGIPTTLANTPHGSLDVAQLENEYEAGRELSEKEKKAFLAAGIIVARTTHILSENLRNVCIWCCGFTGRHSLLTSFSCTVFDWLESNKDTLPLVAHGKLREVMMKIQYKVHCIITQYLTEACSRVPNKETLDMKFTQYQALEGSISMQVPPMIESAAQLNSSRPQQASCLIRGGGGQGGRNQSRNSANSNNSNSRNGSNNNNSNSNNRNNGSNNNSANSTLKKHDGQHPSLRTTNASYAQGVAPLIRNGTVTVPTNPATGTQECANYGLRGHCHSLCTRRENHKPVTEGPRLRNLQDLRAACKRNYDAHKGPNDQDFR